MNAMDKADSESAETLADRRLVIDYAAGTVELA